MLSEVSNTVSKDARMWSCHVVPSSGQKSEAEVHSDPNPTHGAGHRALADSDLGPLPTRLENNMEVEAPLTRILYSTLDLSA